MNVADSDVYTTRFAKRGRENKILIDFLRNNRTNTSVAAFSVRARDHAPVSVPISWAELRTSSPPAFTVATVQQTGRPRLRLSVDLGAIDVPIKLTKQRLRAIVEYRFVVSRALAGPAGSKSVVSGFSRTAGSSRSAPALADPPGPIVVSRL